MTKGSKVKVINSKGFVIANGIVTSFTWPNLHIDGVHFYIPNATIVPDFDGSFIVQL